MDDPKPNSRAAGEINRRNVEKLVAEGVFELPEICRRAHISHETARKYRDMALFPDYAPPHYIPAPPSEKRDHHKARSEMPAGLTPERTIPATRHIQVSQKPTPRPDYTEGDLLRVQITPGERPAGAVLADRREEVCSWLAGEISSRRPG